MEEGAGTDFWFGSNCVGTTRLVGAGSSSCVQQQLLSLTPPSWWCLVVVVVGPWRLCFFVPAAPECSHHEMKCA